MTKELYVYTEDSFPISGNAMPEQFDGSCFRIESLPGMPVTLCAHKPSLSSAGYRPVNYPAMDIEFGLTRDQKDAIWERLHDKLIGR